MKHKLVSTQHGEFYSKGVVEEVENTIRKCKKTAIKAIEHFLDLIDADKCIIEEISDIKIIIDYDLRSDNPNVNVDNYIAIHDSRDNSIIINGRLIKNNFIKQINNKELYNQIGDYISFVLIHEILHSFRDFIFKNNPNISKSDYELYDEYCFKYDSILNDGTDYNKKLLSITFKNDHYIVVIYSNSNNAFEEYFIPKNNKSQKAILRLANCNNKITNSLYLKLFSISTDCKTIVIEDNKDLINVCKFGNNIYKGIEEYLVDAFADIIMNHINKDKYDKKVVLNLLKNNTHNNRLGFSIISKMSIEDIKWFFNSFMQDCYYDRIKDIFKDNYAVILIELYKIYYGILGDLKEEELKEEYESCLKLINR